MHLGVVVVPVRPAVTAMTAVAVPVTVPIVVTAGIEHADLDPFVGIDLAYHHVLGIAPPPRPLDRGDRGLATTHGLHPDVPADVLHHEPLPRGNRAGPGEVLRLRREGA